MNDLDELYRSLRDMIQRYDDGDCTTEEIYFLHDLRDDLNDLFG